jgi:protein gp37
MGKDSGIPWTNDTWNTHMGCKKISTGCKNCYMFRDMLRYGRNPQEIVKTSTATFYGPLKKLKGPLVFVCSWSDFWIEEADPWRAEALMIIRDTPHLQYQVPTKRPERILPWLEKNIWPDSGKIIGTNGLPDNFWSGVSVENQEHVDKRIPLVLDVPSKIRFLSAEPLLGDVDFLDYLSTGKISWVITGGESGYNGKYRPAKLDWFRSIRDQCLNTGVKFFHKQHGGPINKKIDNAYGGRVLDGHTWKEFPEFLI